MIIHFSPPAVGFQSYHYEYKSIHVFLKKKKYLYVEHLQSFKNLQ